MDEHKRYEFQKEENGRWYIVLPEWQGPKADLEMVGGADKFLDRITEEFRNYMIDELGTKSPFKQSVFINIGLKPFILETIDPIPTNAFKLEKIADTPTDGGAIYHIDEWYGEKIDMDMWLCDVLKFMYGHLPENIYIA